MAEAPLRQRADEDVADRLGRNLARAMLAARWFMAPVYVGLLATLLLVAIKFVQKLVLAAPQILVMDTNETILTVLTLIDLSLVGNLLVIVVFAGWENFVGPLLATPETPSLTGIGFSAVKQKLIGSMATIAAIQLLETFVHIENVSKADAMWQLAILLGLGAIGVLLALMDRLAGNEH